jgi:hypothetical protein
VLEKQRLERSCRVRRCHCLIQGRESAASGGVSPSSICPEDAARRKRIGELSVRGRDPRAACDASTGSPCGRPSVTWRYARRAARVRIGQPTRRAARQVGA